VHTWLSLMIAGVIVVSMADSRICTAAETVAPPVMANASSAVKKQPQRWEANGILVERVSLSAGGVMVDMRYRITDFEKAKKVLTRSGSLALIDQKTGLILTVPNMAKVGKLRQLPKDNETTRIYWMFFRNTNGVVKKGSKLTLTMSDVKIKDIVVE
jgi:hypothetical protein